MAGFNSYEPLLRKYMKQLKPKEILEWGPGQSTRIMLEHPDCVVWSVEHEWTWWNKYDSEFNSNPRVNLKLIKAEDGYDYAPRSWGRKFKLIFVDGFCDMRVKCLQTARDLVTEDGVVLLHDSERVKYEEGKRLFEVLEEQDGTAVLKRNLEEVIK